MDFSEGQRFFSVVKKTIKANRYQGRV